MFDENEAEDLEAALTNLCVEAKELYLGSQLTEVENVPSPLNFYRDFISYNRPLVIRGGVNHWPAITKWTNQYLKETIGDLPVTVTVTPNGYADAPQGDLFVMPEERTMKMTDFLNIIDNPESANGVFYIQKQNSNLTEEFEEILCDVETDIIWATEAFGKLPDAVNFWLGDQRAITSMHKDPYENIYCVVRGYKDLVLQPPTDLPWIPYKDYRPAIYKENCQTGNFDVEEINSNSIPWVAIDPLEPDIENYPLYKNSTQYKLRLEAGDILYMPSLWFHHLSQSQGCIAVNYWYDMEYDLKFNYYNLLNKLKSLLNKS